MFILRLNNRLAGGEFEAVRGAEAKKMDSCLRRNDNFLFPRQVVRRRSCAGGFSLMEVLFAVLTLTMGLVFVAANFPLGIMNAAKVAESTRTIIDTHNAQIMTELQLGGITETDYFKSTPPSYIIADQSAGEIRLLSMPNVRVDRYVVMDDPGELYFNTSGDSNPEYCSYTDNGTVDIANRELPYFITTNADDNLESKNIGMMVSPMVDRSDRQVLAKLIDMGNVLSLADIDQPPSFWDDLDIAIYDVAMERNYSWCSLYRHITGNTYSLYIFTLQNHNKNARYAIQEKVVFDDGEPTPGPQDYDRLFPIPWRIELNTFVPMETDWFILEDHTVSQPFANNLAAILQNGSVIIDAQFGHIYKVTEVALVEDGWMIRLDGMLIDDLLTFWVFPPPIVRAAPDYFEGKQPVVKVTRKNFRF